MSDMDVGSLNARPGTRFVTADLADKKQTQGGSHRSSSPRTDAYSRVALTDITATFVFKLSFIACQFWRESGIDIRLAVEPAASAVEYRRQCLIALGRLD